MVNTHDTLPLGIRNNNPGNLRAAVGPDFKSHIVDGFNHFATMEEGTRSLFYLIHQYYFHIGLRTLPAFLGRYAPASENDLKAYEIAVGRALGLNPLSVTTTDLFLDRPWRAIDMARAIIRVECGPAPYNAQFKGEWVDPFTMVTALERTGKW